MHHMIKALLCSVVLVSCCWGTLALANNNQAADNVGTQISVPILTYHRFDPTVPGSMTINTAKFEAQLKWLKDNHYTVIPLKTLVNYLQGEGSPPPPKSVVITADDGHESVYKYMLPLVRKYNIPVTLFIYPSTISNAPYSMTWEQLRELQKTGLFDVQSHTYWHPNFKQDKKKLAPEEYQKLVNIQLNKSKTVLEKKLGTPIALLAWPFGIYDDYLEQEAARAGYIMAFSIDGRYSKKSEKRMAQPRYMIVEGQNMSAFEAIVTGYSQNKRVVSK